MHKFNELIIDGHLLDAYRRLLHATREQLVRHRYVIMQQSIDHQPCILVEYAHNAIGLKTIDSWLTCA